MAIDVGIADEQCSRRVRIIVRERIDTHLLEIQVVTLITAFGIAIVKAYLVAKHFMHINIEKRFITYITVTVLVFMFLFFAGTAPDVMKPSGSNWVKPDWVEADLQGDMAAHGEHH